MERRMVSMFRPDLLNLPEPVAPPGFRARTYRRGDRAVWARIEHLAGEFPSEAAAGAHFLREFRAQSAFLATHCFFVEDAAGEAVGTATAMRGTLDGRPMGRLGWVGVMPRWQGMGLGRYVVALALRRLGEEHREIYLTTQTESARAVGIYLSCGFRPHPHGPDDAEAWAALSASLGRHIAAP